MKKIGYKATNNFKSKPLMYKVGKTYEIIDNSSERRFFHYYENIQDILKRFTLNKNFQLLEIEDLGTVSKKDDDITETNKIKILREIPISEHKLFELDENDNIIYYKDYNGTENWVKYDEKGNTIHYKNSKGNEEWREYDENNNLLHCKYSDGYEIWKEYDKKNNVIHYKDTRGDECWKEYDENSNLIYYKDDEGYEHWKEYDSEGNLIYYKDVNKQVDWRIIIK